MRRTILFWKKLKKEVWKIDIYIENIKKNRKIQAKNKHLGDILKTASLSKNMRPDGCMYLVVEKWLVDFCAWRCNFRCFSCCCFNNSCCCFCWSRCCFKNSCCCCWVWMWVVYPWVRSASYSAQAAARSSGDNSSDSIWSSNESCYTDRQN